MSYSLQLRRDFDFHGHPRSPLASKVATDLKRMQRFYGSPSDADIASYEVEVICADQGRLSRGRHLWLQKGREMDRADFEVHCCGSPPARRPTTMTLAHPVP